ncbi:hypothetical protein PRABACTJOHN_02657 [Parabacteroides johnsonii DSM 18315]|uniref:Uncharacterized protein n=1 Tax=Parabacteroides johnsonii DSM 18315 TaxID=537006 RepID=B7BC88_9BACT|nr:hypothetical protein PRABACTJOHN_02657 [Parabacteroides johnsonii DSM 18315]
MLNRMKDRGKPKINNTQNNSSDSNTFPLIGFAMNDNAPWMIEYMHQRVIMPANTVQDRRSVLLSFLIVFFILLVVFVILEYKLRGWYWMKK